MLAPCNDLKNQFLQLHLHVFCILRSGKPSIFYQYSTLCFCFLKVMHKRCLDLTNLLSEILLMKMQVLAVASRKSVNFKLLFWKVIWYSVKKKNKGCWKLLDICSVCVKTVVNIHYSLQSDSFCEIIICTTCTIVVHYNAWLFFFSQVKKIKEYFLSEF